jgi:hypothetical protein
MKLTMLNSTISQIDAIRCLTENKGPLGKALADLTMQAQGIRWALVGGLAASFHSVPRSTQDVDIILGSEEEIKKLTGLIGFKMSRQHALIHRETGVEIELLTPEFLKLDPKLFELALSSIVVRDGVPVVGREALVALKLQRASHQDLADIQNIIKAGGPVDLAGFPLSDKQLSVYKQVESEIGE